MRDAQGQSYWHWCRPDDFALTPTAAWDRARRGLGLASQLGAPPTPASAAATRAAAAAPPLAADAFGHWARVEPGGTPRVVAGGVAEPEIDILSAPPGSTIHDLAPTADGLLFVAMTTPVGGRVTMHDLLDRFDPIAIAAPGFAPDRICVGDDDAVWVLDRAGRQLRRLIGAPLDRRVATRPRAESVFRPEPANPNAPRLVALGAVDLSGLPEIMDAVALPDGRLAVLGLGAGGVSTLYLVSEQGVSGPVDLGGLRGAFSVGIFGADKLAFLVAGADVAVATPLPEADPDTATDADAGAAALPLLGLSLPLRRGTGGRFVKGVPGEPLAYPATPRAGASTDGEATPPRPFARLVAPSRPRHARLATVAGGMIEADAPRTVWHRLYLEAQVPQGCGITVLLAAADDEAALAALPTERMHPHRFGTTGQTEGPLGVWRDVDSEKPFLPSATGQPRRRDRCGLFTALIQGSEGPVRRLRGRFLRIAIVLSGPGFATPMLHAVRVWGPRAAWRDRYLPEYMRAEDGSLAAGADFLDRYLGIFEAVLTPLEDQVAHAWRLTRPDTVPAEGLDWLAEWIGATLDQGLSEAAKRRFLAQAVRLWRRRGTLPTLRSMLDIVTDGAVARGEIVVLEHFHLRRTFATILGADLSDATNPLTPWAATSGNSHLGPTFFLGAEDRRAFFALFRPSLLDDPLTDEAERAAALDDLAAFFDGHAHRITILIHGAMDDTRRELVARVVARDVPAHVQTDIVAGPGSLVLALSSLLAVDSRFGAVPPRADLTLGRAEISQAFLTGTPSIDPRMEGRG